MAEYENKQLGVCFSLPDKLTVREQLAYREQVLLNIDDNAYIRNWIAGIPLLKEWQCEAIPEPEAFDFDSETDMRKADIVNFVANTVAGHMLTLEDVPKNS